MFVIAVGDGPHIAARIGVYRTGMLALDLLSPILAICYPDSVTYFVHGRRPECANG